MEWSAIDAKSLLSHYRPQIFAEPIINNRFIGLLGLVQERSVPGRSWILRDARGVTRLLAAETSDELIPLSHPMFPLTPDVVHEIRARFPAPMLLTLHDHQCEQLEEVGELSRWKCAVQLRSNLYLLAQNQLVLPESAQDGAMQKLSRCSDELKKMIMDFARETLGKEMSPAQAEHAFERNFFYGWFRGEELVAIAAATRFSVKSRCISYVFTRPEFRGQALAAHLLGAGIQHLFKADAHEQVFLYADAQNLSSNRLYQKLGFRIVSRSKTYTL